MWIIKKTKQTGTCIKGLCVWVYRPACRCPGLVKTDKDGCKGVCVCVWGCTFLPMSRSSLWMCEVLSCCWCVRNLLRDASSSRSSFTFSSLFIAPSLPPQRSYTVSSCSPPPLDSCWLSVSIPCVCVCVFYFVLCCVSFSSSWAKMCLRWSSACCKSSCWYFKLYLNYIIFNYLFLWNRTVYMTWKKDI